VNEIKISKRMIAISLILIGAATAAVWDAPQIMDLFQARASAQSIPTPGAGSLVDLTEADGRESAITGARQFYTVDFQKGQQAWLDSLCAVSTQMGCLMDQKVIAPNLWEQFIKAKTITTVQVKAQEKVQEQLASTRGNAFTQVWRLQIQLSAAWPMQQKPQTTFPALALVVKENGAWKFERFLTEEEITVFSQKDGPK
jgi:hypothetical protein